MKEGSLESRNEMWNLYSTITWLMKSTQEKVNNARLLSGGIYTCNGIGAMQKWRCIVKKEKGGKKKIGRTGLAKKKICKIGEMAKVRNRQLGQKETYDIIYP